MTRRTFLLAAAAQQFPGTRYRDYSRCLPDYLRGLAARAYQRRNEAIAKLTTADAVAARQRWVRETFWNLAGGMPQRTPLNPRSTGSFERPGYRVEKIVYESRPGYHVPANLYIPAEARGPLPAILFQMGHSANGKAYTSYQRCCQGLVKLGFLVLAFDPMGQGERIYYPGSDPTRSRVGAGDNEHTYPGRQMLLNGDTSTRMQVWDAMRSLDYLAAHPLADPKRLASTGQSGGGTLTMLLSAVDDRLAAAVVCSGNTENIACAGFNPPGATDDAEQNLLGSGPLGFDRWDVLYPLAPKPLLISVSDKDFFGTYSPDYISNGWEEFLKLKKVYEVLGHPDQLAWKDTPLPHGLSYDTRLYVYNWFSRWLKGETRPIAQEPPTEPEPDRNLWVSDSGNVVQSFGGLTPFLLNRERKPARRPVDLARLLGVERPAAANRATTLRRVAWRDVDIEAIEVASAPRVWVPAWMYLPRAGARGDAAFLLLEPGSRNARWHEGELYQALAARGYPVCAASPRGIDDLLPEFGRGNPRYTRSHADEEDYTWSSLILGRPLLGQRVTDILALVAALAARPEFRGRRFVVAALDKLTVPALCAAGLEPRIERLYLSHGLVSFRSVVETENYRAPFSNFVFGLLGHTDLPEIAATIAAPRKLVLAGIVNADDGVLNPDEVRAQYPSAVVRAEGGWDAVSILSSLE